MNMIPRTNTARTQHRWIAALVLIALLAGCSQPPAVNPWRDDSISAATWSTASADAVWASGAEPAIRTRDCAQTEVPHVRDAVAHYPLWWEDPFMDKGDENGKFAWSWQDYFAMPYGLGRFLLNTMAWPVSAIVTPPGTSMLSDGQVGRNHDAQVGKTTHPSATRADFDNRDPETADSPDHGPVH